VGGKSKLKVLCNELSDWLRDNHPDCPQMTPGTIANQIRDLWKKH
jgi:hypothetical protein